MTKKNTLPLSLVVGISLIAPAMAQQDAHRDALTKANNAANRVATAVAIFQPYLLKARQLFFDAKQLGQDVKQASKAVRNGDSDLAPADATGGAVSNNGGGQDGNGSGYSNSAQAYLPNQSLPVNNPATINNDATGNWGNQNNALYGNFLDVMTGTIMGAGEAESAPQNVDVIFVAANGTYQLWTPSYARNEVAAQYTSASTHEIATKWADVNETEIAETRVTLGQFDQIQNNSQILNVVKNAQNYDSSITESERLDGKVFAVKAELENRTVYGLIAVVKQVGTDGSNGYLKIKIKSQGISDDPNGQPSAAAYQR